jgi:2-polyprenyl-3-methyl-5-hydroxy-6-metoxy-1,4-benzoquinol methylase
LRNLAPDALSALETQPLRPWLSKLDSMSTEALEFKGTGYRRQLVRTGNAPRLPGGLSGGRISWLPEDKDALIVDVGCAWGTLLLELNRAGYRNLVGVEGDEELAAEARERCNQNGALVRVIHSEATVFFERIRLVADRITLFHVLEHFSPEAGKRLLRAIRLRLHPERGQLVVEVPNVSSVTGMNMQCSDLTHATAFTEFSMKQLLDEAGFERISVICNPPPFRFWRIGRDGSGVGWHFNRSMHTLLYRITNSGPRPTCFCPALLVTAS